MSLCVFSSDIYPDTGPGGFLVKVCTWAGIESSAEHG